MTTLYCESPQDPVSSLLRWSYLLNKSKNGVRSAFKPRSGNKCLYPRKVTEWGWTCRLKHSLLKLTRQKRRSQIFNTRHLWRRQSVNHTQLWLQNWRPLGKIMTRSVSLPFLASISDVIMQRHVHSEEFVRTARTPEKKNQAHRVQLMEGSYSSWLNLA